MELIAPAVKPVLDPDFRPAALAWRAFAQRIQGRSEPIRIAIEQGDGSTYVFERAIERTADPAAAAVNLRFLEREVKCLLLTSKDKNAAVPQATSLTELGVPELATNVWHGILVPKGTPPERVAILEAAFVQAIKTEKFRQFMEARGATAEGLGSVEFRKQIDSEYKAMGEVAASLGMAKK